MRRHRITDIEEALSRSPAVALLGPRQVGKTTLALDLVDDTPGAIYLDLESPSDRAQLSDPEAWFAAHEGHLVVLDEIQRVPDLFAVLRVVIDRRRRRGARHGQFLVLGSASLDLLKQGSESLAGRLALLELGPFRVDEVGARHEDVLWSRGGFPDSYLARTDTRSLAWRQDFVRTYLERDIPALGPRIPAETLRRFWTMLAHEQGQLLNAARFAGALGVSGMTIARYVDLLVDLLLVRRLTPCLANVGKRLTKSPKLYVRDSGVVHALLGLGTYDDVLSHPVAGGSYEGFVIEHLAEATTGAVSFYRTAAGAEIDLVIEPADGERWAVEIKRSTAPVVSRGFYVACDDLGVKRRIVVHPGDRSFPLPNGVEAMSLHDAVAAVRGREDP